MAHDDPQSLPLREAFEGRPAGPPRTDCPEPERLYDAASGALPPAEVAPILDHVAACAACAQDWRLAREIAGPMAVGAGHAIGSAPEVREPANRPADLRRWSAAIAISGLLVAAIALFFLRSPEADPTWRDGNASAITAITRDDEPLPREAARLRWAPDPAGAVWEVTVTTEALDPIATGQVRVSQFDIPPAALVGLPPLSRVVWRVQRILPDGTLEESPSFYARIR